eukprot:TRINITY_DN7592_c0_g1_i8.p1 TRINITY_DN7592_c0_g1~~TRINITY_DN7592_c0_g1_i8.p1  ORF type:complete len:250 (-),score=37.63 TRINITY_DN7592_c0_g1_i8:329-1078(-)
MNTVLEIYPFKWVFELDLVEEKQGFSLICEDLVGALVNSLRSMETRTNLIKKHFLDLEAEYVKRLNEKEKNSYRTKLEDDESHWKFLIKEQSLDIAMPDFDLGEGPAYFMKNYASQKLKKIEEAENKARASRVVAPKAEPKKRKLHELDDYEPKDRVSAYTDSYEENIDEINKKIEMENKLKEKQDKKLKKTKVNFLQLSLLSKIHLFELSLISMSMIKCQKIAVNLPFSKVSCHTCTGAGNRVIYINV